MKKRLIIAILIFIVVACVALYLVLNKGHVGETVLVAIEEVLEEDEQIKPQLQIELEDKYLSSKSKEKTNVIATIDGETLTNGVVLESLNEDVAKINSDNEIVAVSNGKAKIKAAYDGIEGTCDVRVITPIKSMTFTSTSSSIKVGKDLQMKLKVSPSDASMDTLKYSSSDEEIATVNANGIVTGVSTGKVTITVYDEYSEIEKKVNLRIR